MAIACDEQEDIFSGSIVVDHGNTADSAPQKMPPLVAIYTSAYKGARRTERTQAQSLALSTDGGITWSKYAGNPVLGRGSANFRDPKVFRYEATGRLLLGHGGGGGPAPQVVLYSRRTSKTWEYLSTFGPANATGGESGNARTSSAAGGRRPGQLKWVLVVNLNPGGLAGGSGGQYFVGNFDGVQFTADSDSLAQRVPTGPAIAYRIQLAGLGPGLLRRRLLQQRPGRPADHDRLDEQLGLRQLPPTSPWRSGMSLAREVRLTAVNGSARLIQQPAC